MQVKVSNARRYYTCGFNLTVGAAESLRFVRENGREYPIQFIEAAFNEETSGFELFIEFEEQIKATVFMAHLNAMAAGMDPIPLSTSHNDAAIAVLRVRQTASKTKLGYTRGQPTKPLADAVRFRLDNAGASGAGAAGAAAPSVEIEHMSKQLGRVEDVVGQTRDVAEEARNAAEAAASNSNEVAIKVGSIDGKIDSMKLFEEENASLKQQLAHKTKEVDRVEHSKGEMTKDRNQWKKAALEEKVERTKAEEALANKCEEFDEKCNENAELRNQIKTLIGVLEENRKQLLQSRHIIASYEDIPQSRKRGRAADGDEAIVDDSSSDSDDN